MATPNKFGKPLVDLYFVFVYNIVKGKYQGGRLMSFWSDFLENERKEKYFKDIEDFVKTERESKNIFPEEKDVYKLFNLSGDIIPDVVILGQDPYPKSGDANGLAFSVDRDYDLPASLRNIFQEIENDLGFKNTNGDLSPWVREGIFLLNTRLTVEEGKPMSHGNIGYDIFIDRVLKKITELNPDVIFLLLGRKAEEYQSYCKPENRVITSHPSPLGAYRGFNGSSVFSKVNNILQRQGKKVKSWRT